jgi:hypothetical protein
MKALASGAVRWRCWQEAEVKTAGIAGVRHQKGGGRLRSFNEKESGKPSLEWAALKLRRLMSAGSTSNSITIEYRAAIHRFS